MNTYVGYFVEVENNKVINTFKVYTNAERKTAALAYFKNTWLNQNNNLVLDFIDKQ